LTVEVEKIVSINIKNDSPTGQTSMAIKATLSKVNRIFIEKNCSFPEQ
jgi:hypothetical protein